jgi:hypothetical protein
MIEQGYDPPRNKILELELALEAIRAAAAEEMRAKCEAIVDTYAKPGRFKVCDTWRDDMSPAEVYETGVIDVSGWIKEHIAALKTT